MRTVFFALNGIYCWEKVNTFFVFIKALSLTLSYQNYLTDAIVDKILLL